MSQLLDLIKRHEGFRKDAYWDKTGQEMWQGINPNVIALSSAPMDWKQKLGRLTIGYGFNLEADMSRELAEHILEWHIQQALATARKYEWWPELGDNRPPAFTEPEPFSPRQAVIVSMIHQLGPEGFAGKTMMLELIEMAVAGKATFGDVYADIRERKWVNPELAEMMRTGEWPSVPWPGLGGRS